VGQENQAVLRAESGDRLEMRTREAVPPPGTKVRLGWERSVPLSPD